MILLTVNKEEIVWRQRITKERDPSPSTVSMRSMKFGVSLFNSDLNDPSISFYDVVLVKL